MVRLFCVFAYVFGGLDGHGLLGLFFCGFWGYCCVGFVFVARLGFLFSYLV